MEEFIKEQARVNEDVPPFEQESFNSHWDLSAGYGKEEIDLVKFQKFIVKKADYEREDLKKVSGN